MWKTRGTTTWYTGQWSSSTWMPASHVMKLMWHVTIGQSTPMGLHQVHSRFSPLFGLDGITNIQIDAREVHTKHLGFLESQIYLQRMA